MSNLRIPASSIPEGGVTIDAVVPASDIQPPDVKELPMRAVTLGGDLWKEGGCYFFKGKVSGTFLSECDRCLDVSANPFDLDVMWVFDPGIKAETLDDLEVEDEEDEEDATVRCRFEGHEVNLALPLWEEVVLAAPSKFLCKPDCAGLCQKCGANLNREECACPDDNAADSGFAGLNNMFPDLRPKDTEE